MANRYWVGGAGNWSDTAKWSTASGGASGASVPGVGDTAIFDSASDSGSNFTATVDTTVTVDNLTFTSVDRVITLGTAGNLTVTGATSITASASANGVTISGNATLGAVSITSASTVNINGNTISATSFSSDAGVTRTLAFGTNGVINITGNNGTVCNITAAGTHTITGSGTINFTYSGSTGTRTILFNADSGATGIDLNVTNGTDAVTFSGTVNCKSLNFTGYSGTFTNSTLNLYGSLTISSGMTVAATTALTVFAATTSQTITTNGKTLDFPIDFDGIGGTWTLQDNLTVGATRQTELLRGTLALGSYTLSTGTFKATGSNTRTLDFGTGKLVLTFSGASNTTILDSGTLTSATISGSKNVEVTGTGTNQYTILYGLTGGTSGNAINLSLLKTTTADLRIGGAFNTVTIDSSLASFSLSQDVNAYGDFTITNLGSWPGSSNKILIFSATSTFTPNGVTVGDDVEINAAGATVTMNGALTLEAARNLTVTAGTFNANNYNVTTTALLSNNSNTRTITMGSGTWTLTANSTQTVWNTPTTTNLTLNANTSTIVLSGTAVSITKTFAGGGLTYNNLTIGGGAGTSQIVAFTGGNTFNTLASTKTVAHTVRFPTGTTTTVSDWTIKGTAGNLVSIVSSSSGTQATLSKSTAGVVSGLDYLSIQDSNATPATTWYAGANSTNVSGNTGWIFTAAPAQNTGNFFFMFQ